ncbi:MAG TPA: hypothetical protein VH682_21105 [Gemmataceae bacterium]|jgi:hypothetical protein
MMCRSSTALLLVALLGVFVLGGCSSGKKGFAVKGSVSYKGKPLSAGVVRFHMADNRMAMAMIQSDGSFAVTDLFPGEAKVTVEEDTAARMRKRVPAGAKVPKASAPKPPPAPSAPIPDKYKDVTTAGLVFTLAPEQPLEIKLD